MTPKQVDKEARRREIAFAAADLFSQRGLARTTIQDIAQNAGIGKGTVYEYFSSKDEILSASFEYIFHDMDMFLQQKLQTAESPLDSLRGIFDGMYTFIVEMQLDMAEILLVFWAEGILEDPATNVSGVAGQFDMKEIYTQYSALIIDILNAGKADGTFREDLDSMHMASAIIGAIDGLMLQWVIYKKAIPLQDILNTYLEALLRGILHE